MIYTLRQKKLIILSAILILGIFIFLGLREIFTALLGAVVFYTLFKPFFLTATKKWKWPRSVSGIAVILVSFLIIVVPFSSLSLMIFNKILEFRSNPAEINQLIHKIDDFALTHLNEPQFVQNMLDKAQEWAMTIFSSALNGIFGIFVKVMVMYFLLYFMLTGHEKFEATVFKFMPFRERNSIVFGEELKKITYSNVIGQGVIAIIQGVLVGVGFLIFGLQDPFFWAVISSFLCFLPVVGAPLVFVPAGLFAISNGDTGSGVGIILWGFLLVTNIDNFLRFIINKKVADTHPLVTIVGVIIGLPFFGILGLVFGPLLLSYFILLVRMYEIRYVKGRQIDVSRLKHTAN